MTTNNSSAPEMTVAEMQAEIAKLRAANAALAPKKGKPTMKVSNGGGVSVYGLGRFPFTFYREQLETFLGMGEELKAFAEAHKAELKVKDETKEAYFARTGKSPLPAKGEVSDADETNGAAAGIPGAQVVKGAVVIRRVAA